MLFLAGRLVLGGHVEDAVGVDVEGDFDLRYASGCGGDAVEMEHSYELVVLRHRTLALQDLYLHARLVVGRG